MASESERISWCVVYTCLALVTIVGNSLSIPVFLSNVRLRRMPTSLLLINLAVADLLVGAVAVPMYMVFQWPESSLANNVIFRNAYASVDLITGFASLFGLAAIALERVYSVCWPHKHRVTRKAPYLAVILACWLLSGLQMVLRSLSTRQLIEFKAFFYSMVFALSFVLVVICVAYIAVWQKVRGHKVQQLDRRNTRIPGEQEKKLVQTLAIITGVFMITWLPFHVLNFVVFLCVSCRIKVAVFIPVIKLLHYSNSFMNLIIYSFRFPDFRNTIAQFFRRSVQVAPLESQMIGRHTSKENRCRTGVHIETVHASSL